MIARNPPWLGSIPLTDNNARRVGADHTQGRGHERVVRAGCAGGAGDARRAAGDSGSGAAVGTGRQLRRGVKGCGGAAQRKGHGGEGELSAQVCVVTRGWLAAAAGAHDAHGDDQSGCCFPCEVLSGAAPAAPHSSSLAHQVTPLGAVKVTARPSMGQPLSPLMLAVSMKLPPTVIGAVAEEVSATAATQVAAGRAGNGAAKVEGGRAG